MNTPTKLGYAPWATFLVRTAAILWVIWGLVHVLAGCLTIGKETSAAIQGIADAVDPALIEASYPDAAGAIVNQHGFNLLWIGAFTTISASFVWQRSTVAIFGAAVVAGLTDLGYFLFLDLGGYVRFVPGTVMTLICLSAILASTGAFFLGSNHSQP